MINTNNFISSALKPIDLYTSSSSKLIPDEDIATKKQKSSTYFISGITTIAGGVGGWEYVNKNFNKQKKEIVKNYDTYIDELMERAIKKRIEIEGSISQAEINEMRGFKYDRYRRRKMDKPIVELKNNFKRIFAKNTIMGTLVGATIGGLLLLKMHYDEKKTNKIINNNQQLNIESGSSKMNTQKKISFGARYWNNEFYSDEDEQIAEEVANYPFDKDLVDTNNDIQQLIPQSGTESGYTKNNDIVSQYYDGILARKIPVHPDPPSSCNIFDKILGTKRYKDYQNREILIKDNKRFKKIRRLINYLRLEKFKQEEKRIERETKLQMQSAFIKSKLFHSFISIINKKDSSKNILVPNAIMLEGQNRTENIKTIKWMIERSDTAYTYLDYDPAKYSSSVNFLAQIESALEKAQDNYKKTNGKRTILYINNFDLLIQKGMDTSDLKNLIQELNSEYKTTLVFETPDSSKLDPVALQDHRFGLKYIIDENIDPKTFKNLELEFFKTNTTKILNSDGYRFNYIPGREKCIDLFLGAFGYDKNTLWVEGKDISDINIAYTFIDSIKKLKKFNEITKIQTSSDSKTKSELLVASGFKPIDKYTIEKQMIYEKQI